MPRRRRRMTQRGSMRAAGRRGNRSQLSLSQKLVLYQWLLGLFGVEHFEELAEHLRGEALVGMDENNIHHFYHALCLHLSAERRPELPDDLLLEYDQAIVAITQSLNERRVTRGEPPVVWKYYQYLTLLFTEIYLDRYFRDPGALLRGLNKKITAFNEDKEQADHVTALDEAADARSQINKLAFWMATGSGKTLLMHAHILQYRRCLETSGRAGELNRIILLTPNEGLSQQHLREFEAAGIPAELFSKEGPGLFTGQAVAILEVTKLKDEMGDKTVAVDAFEGNNLVLIDEGHRGASAGEEGTWMRLRNELCENGFSFEYSATFGQAVKGDPGLTDAYARSVLFDYSYRWFYSDGFGKDYQILNLEDDSAAEWMTSYLTACLLAFFQQQRLYEEQAPSFRPFNIERPLWVFVGGSVNAVRSEAREAVSDVVAIIQFLSGYIADRQASIARIERVLNDGLVTATGRNLFAGRFVYLNSTGLSAAKVFDETLATLFNAPGGGALYLDNLRGVTGEIALRVADNSPFGVINVGDDTKLLSLCEEKGLNVRTRDFSGSLFHEIDQPSSMINVLIGSKKFSEGWNSWRVSTMGLMNVGRGEGAQVIQLFGRGVRLKGYQLSLKRSTSPRTILPEGLRHPGHIGILETLNIFGIRADYMAQFRDFLEEEGLSTNDERIEFVLPIIKNLGRQRLKTVRLKKTINGVSTEWGQAFRRLGPIPTLQPPDQASGSVTDYFQRNPVVLNWYPKVQAVRSGGAGGIDAEATPNEAHLHPAHIAFLNIDYLFFELERFKAERGWHNLNVTREGIEALLADTTWYRILIPESELAFDSFDRVHLWQEIALAMLRKYAERYYTSYKHEWELPHLEYQILSEDDPNFPIANEKNPDHGYRILIEESQHEIAEKLKQLKIAIEAGDLKPWEFRGIKAVWFDRHLYQPMVYLDGNAVEISPIPLNKGERRFVEDLKAFHDATGVFFANKELYLLRNLSRGHGVGFFEAGNFYPDFILWLLVGDRQHIMFVDPKGIHHLGKNDPKVNFYKAVKLIEARLGDQNVTLDSYIVSNTPFHEMHREWDIDKAGMRERHIVFQEAEGSYIGDMLGEVATSGLGHEEAD